MATTGFILPSARTVEAGDGTWTDDVNILADDGSEATFSLAVKNTSGRWLVGQTFGFDSLIPAAATISQVTIRAEWRINATASTVQANLDLQAFVSGGAVGSVRTNSSEPTTLTTDDFNLGGDRAWVRADLLDGTFELKVRGRNGNDADDPSYRVDHIAVSVTYETSKKKTIGALLARRALTAR